MRFKKFYFIIVFSLIVIEGITQIYPNKFGEYNFPFFGNDGIYFYNDTCIKGEKYKIPYLGRPYDPIKFKKRGTWFLKIDSPKILIYYPYLDKEYVLYDFSAITGSNVTIRSPKPFIDQNSYFYDTLAYDSITRQVASNTIQYYHGVPRRVLTFVGDTIKWVEGFGAINYDLLDPFGIKRDQFNYKTRIYTSFANINDTSYWFKSYPLFNGCDAYKICQYESAIPTLFYFSQDCNNASKIDTIQLSCSKCQTPKTYKKFLLYTNIGFNSCRDTMSAKLYVQESAPTFRYRFLSDSVAIVKPPNKSVTYKVMLYDAVDSTCNDTLTGTRDYSCDYCTDSIFRPSIVSTKPLDTFYCPDSIIRSYSIKSGNTDGSLIYKLLHPLPKYYGTTPYIVEHIVSNSVCNDTIKTDTLMLYCEKKCKFAELPCAHIEADKQKVNVGESISYTAICDSNCLGFNFKWDNTKSVEVIPLNYADTIFSKKIFYWNNYMAIDSMTHVAKVIQKSELENIENNPLFEIFDEILYISATQKYFDISIYDLMGNSVLQAKNNDKIQLNILSSGIYILKINNSYIHKIFVNK